MIKQKNKICIECGRSDKPHFSKKRCINCAKKSYSKIKKLSEKGKVKKEEKKEVLRDDFRFYMSLWKERKHNCVICDKYLGETPLTWMFHHLLEKSKFPQFRHHKDCISIVCLQCHDQVTRGYITQKMKSLADFTKEKLLYSLK